MGCAQSSPFRWISWPLKHPFFFWSEGLHSSQWQLLISSQEVLPQVHKEHTFLLNSVELDADLPCYSQTSLSIVSHLCSQATFQHHQIRFQQEKGNQGVLSCMHTDIAVSLISQYVIWVFFFLNFTSAGRLFNSGTADSKRLGWFCWQKCFIVAMGIVPAYLQSWSDS